MDQPTREQMRQDLDKVIQKYNRWTVLGEAPKNKRGEACWLCRCDCGKERAVVQLRVRKGESKSCGTCNSLIPPTAQVRSKSSKNSKSPEYTTWQCMRQRCYVTKVACYPRYGGKGIRVCQRWLDSFDNFLADMGTRPSPKHTIDRIDSTGNYSPENCKWSTIYEQNQNRSSVTLNPTLIKQIYHRRAEGASASIIADEFGVDRSTIVSIVNGKHWQECYRNEAFHVYGQGLESLLKAAEHRGFEAGYAARSNEVKAGVQDVK